MLASASDDGTAKLADFKTGKVILTGTTPNKCKELDSALISLTLI